MWLDVDEDTDTNFFDYSKHNEYELDMKASTEALYARVCFSDAGPTSTFARPFIKAVTHEERNAMKAHVMQFAYSSCWSAW